MNIDKILEDIKKGNCITTDCITYVVYGYRGKVLHKLTDEQVRELVKLGKVKLIEQTRTYRVEVLI